METEGWRPHALVYLTDGEGRFPEAEPDYPVLWLVRGEAVPPFGDRMELPPDEEPPPRVR